MSNHGPQAPLLPPAQPSVGGEEMPPLGGGGDTSLDSVGETALPFTGSVFTAPIAALGLVLTFTGWLLLRLGFRDD